MQADESLAKSIQGDMAVLERMENEVLDLSRKIRQAQLSDSDTVGAGASPFSFYFRIEYCFIVFSQSFQFPRWKWL